MISKLNLPGFFHFAGRLLAAMSQVLLCAPGLRSAGTSLAVVALEDLLPPAVLALDLFGGNQPVSFESEDQMRFLKTHLSRQDRKLLTIQLLSPQR